jgi:sugar phosphate isomerase/epimerase
MRFGVFTVSTPEYGIRETVKILKELGYDGVEWRIADPVPFQKPEIYNFDNRYWSYNLSTLDVKKIDIDAAEIKDICDRDNLETCSLTTYLGVCESADIERVMKAANIMECKNIRVNVPAYDEKENYKVIFNKTIENVKLLEELAKKYCVRINFETHMGNIIPSASAAYRFASNFDPKYIGIIFDPGNMVYEGFENYKLGIELLGEYLAHVHVKNSVWKLTDKTSDNVEVWKPIWAPFKKGYADIRKLVHVLKDIGYEGYISVEDFSNEADTYTKLKDNIEFLKSLI